MKIKFQFKSVKSRLTFYMLVVAFLPLLIASMIVSYQRAGVIKEIQTGKLCAIRDLKASQINTWIKQKMGDIRTISHDFEIRNIEKIISGKNRDDKDAAVFEKSRKLLNRYLKNYTDYVEIFIINADSGRIEISTDKRLEGEYRSKNLYFTVPLKTGDLYIKGIYYSRTMKKPLMAISVPIFSLAHQGEQITGILVAYVDLKQLLYPLLLDRTGMGKTGETLIVNKKLLALNALRWHENAPLKLKIEAKPALLASMGKTGIVEAKDYRGVKVLAAYTYLPEVQWGFVAKQNLHEIYAPVRSVSINIMIIFILLAIVGYLLILLLAKNFSRPLLNMGKAVDKIAKGDLSVRTDVTSADELGFLSESINTTADSIVSLMTIQKANSDITEILATAGEFVSIRKNLLKKLMDVTDSNLGIYHRLNRQNSMFEHFTSIGINSDLLKPFDASINEGEFGKALATKKIVRIKDIPDDTLFKFKTFTGTILPKEIVTIPVIIDGKVPVVISLASINGYSSESLEIVDHVWQGINTGMSNLLGNEETKRLGDELKNKNKELQTQAEEIRQTAGELEEQNAELALQKNRVEEANRLKSEFLSNMSHELRTPLNSVMVLSRVLIMQAKEKLSDEEAGYLEIIERNGRNLLELINDILDLSKIEAGKMDITPRLFCVDSIVETIMERLEPVAAEKNIKMIQNFSDGLFQIESDETRLHQILQNLISNAIKFTEKGSVTVSVHSDETNIYIEVADTGIGIRKKDLPHIFEEFRQVDGGSARKYEGTGLGLAIADRSAKMLGGGLTVESITGKGSTFSLILPIKWDEKVLGNEGDNVNVVRDGRQELEFGNDTKKQPKVQEEKLKPRMPKHVKTVLTKDRPVILIVEDNADNLITIKAVLQDEYDLLVAADGKEGLSMVLARQPDIVLLDMSLPGTDGFTVVEKIKADEHCAHIPVIALTARAMKGEREKMMEAGCDDYISKPFDPVKIINNIRKLLNR